MPRGAMFEQIQNETGYPKDVIWSAAHALEREGKIEGRSPFAYDPEATDTDANDPGSSSDAT